MTVELRGERRLARAESLDTLRTILVVWIIGGHALLGYSSVGGWAYDEVHEVTFNPTVEMVLAATLGPTALFLMGTFFLIAGLFTPTSLERKGTRPFVRERSLRLGVPLVLSAFVTWPLTMWVAYRSTGRSMSYGFLLGGRPRLMDSGGLWFAEVLLLFSLLFVAGKSLLPWVRVSATAPLTVPRMLGLAAVIAATTFLVRLRFDARGSQYFDLHVWQWPQLLGMFTLGIAGARRGWAHVVPGDLGPTSGRITLACVVGGPVAALALGVDNLSGDSGPFLGGWRVESLALSTYEGVLVVFGSLWLLGMAQRRLTSRHPRWHRLRRSSFAAFILQGPVLILLAVAMRPVGVPAEVKALVVAVGGVAACFSLGWLLVTRTRVGRIV